MYGVDFNYYEDQRLAAGGIFHSIGQVFSEKVVHLLSVFFFFLGVNNVTSAWLVLPAN